MGSASCEGSCEGEKFPHTQEPLSSGESGELCTLRARHSSMCSGGRAERLHHRGQRHQWSPAWNACFRACCGKRVPGARLRRPGPGPRERPGADCHKGTVRRPGRQSWGKPGRQVSTAAGTLWPHTHRVLQDTAFTSAIAGTSRGSGQQR